MAPMQGQSQQNQQHLQPQPQLGQQVGFRNQSVQGIRNNAGPNNHGMMNQGLLPNQMIASGGQRPQQTNVLLNQALGPIQGTGGHPQFAQQNQIIGGQQQTTATLVTQSGPPMHQQPQPQPMQQQPQQQQIHFNSQNVSGTTLANLMQHQQQATQQQQSNSQPPPPQQPQQHSTHDVRNRNLLNIQQLQKQLEACKQTELEFAQQHVDHTIPSGHTFFDQSTGMHYSKSSSGDLGTNFRNISASPRTGPDPETDLNLSKGHLLVN